MHNIFLISVTCEDITSLCLCLSACACVCRLQQECVEAARMAEDLARQAAEWAVRQLKEEHTAQIIIDTKTEEPDNEEQ